MDAWDYLDRSSDLASIYGVQQRQQIVAAQQQTQRLILRQIEIEQSRANAEAQGKAEENIKREKLKRARKAVCAIENLFQSLESREQVSMAEVVNFVVTTEQLQLWSANEIFENLEDIRAVSTLQNKAILLKRKWGETQAIKYDPMKLLTDALPLVNEILTQSDTVFERCLFVHPKHERKIRSSIDGIIAKGTELNQKIESSKKAYENKQRELEAKGCIFKNGELLQIPDVNLAGGMFGQLQRLENSYNEMQGFAKSHDSEIEELEKLRAAADKLTEDMRFGALISQADMRRKSLIRDFNEKDCDFRKIEEAKSLVSEVMATLDAELDKLAAKVPAICFDEHNKSIHSAIFWLNEIRQQQNSDASLSALEKTYFYPMVYKHGSLYGEIKRELQDIISYFGSICVEYARQAEFIHSMTTELNEGNVFKAQKMVESQSFKICFSNLQFGQQLTAALKPYEDARDVAASLKACETKRNSFFGKLLTSNKDYDLLRQRAEDIQKNAKLLKGEIHDAILTLFK